MGLGGGGSSNAGAPAPSEPKGVPKRDPNKHKAVSQNRTEESPLSRPLLPPGGIEPHKDKGLIG